MPRPKKQHGGARAGSGPKPREDSNVCTVSASVSKETYDRLAILALKPNVTISMVVRNAIERYLA